jgi:hypothetical protein
MRILLLPLLALAGTPAAASEAMDDHGYLGAVQTLPSHGRSFVYFGHDDRLGPRVFSRDDGFFQGQGGGVAVQRGRAVYDYDRDYPMISRAAGVRTQLWTMPRRRPGPNPSARSSVCRIAVPAASTFASAVSRPRPALRPGAARPQP